MSICPLCGSTRVRRSHARNIKESLLKLLGRRAYRCIHCGWRGILRVRRAAKTRRKPSLNEVLATIIVIVIILVLILYWLMKEPEKDETPVQTGWSMLIDES
jgi:hypothetical protein